MSLQARVQRLEGIVGGEPCRRCGFREHELMTPFVRMTDDTAPTAPKGSAPEISRCPDCGRLISFTMRFGEDDD